MKLNIVQGLYIVLRPNTNSRKILGFHRGGRSSHKTTPDPPQSLPYTYFIPKFYFTIFLVVNENITISLHDGEIWHMCEHDTDILYTSAFKMAELYRFIQICLHGTSKKSIDFSPLLFSGGQSIKSINT